MADSDQFFQKAFYLGVGIASYAMEKANDKFQELKQQAEKIAQTPDFPVQIQKMAEEMVNKGKMSTEEARNFVEEMMKQVQPKSDNNPANSPSSSQPRPIDIILDDDEQN